MTEIEIVLPPHDPGDTIPLSVFSEAIVHAAGAASETLYRDSMNDLSRGGIVLLAVRFNPRAQES